MRRSGFGLRWLAGPPGAGIEGSVLKSRCRRQRRLRAWFVGVAVTAGVDVRIPDGSGSGRRDAPAAVEAATAAITLRFGAEGVARRGDAGAGGGRGQHWPVASAGLAVVARPRRGWMNALRA